MPCSVIRIGCTQSTTVSREHALPTPIRQPGPCAQADFVPALGHPFWRRPYRLAFLSRQHQRGELRLEESHEVGRTIRCTEPGLYSPVAVVSHGVPGR